MINKKILLSLLTIGLLSCIVSAGTWAYFQDTVTSEDNVIKTANLSSEYSLNSGTSWIGFSGELATFGPFSVFNIVPDSTEHTVQSILVHNIGNTTASVSATVTPVGTPDSVANLVIEVGGQTIYTGGSFVTGPIVLDLGDLLPNGADSVDASITYTYTDTGANQNIDEVKNIPFDLAISVRATNT